jgi:multidrug efflux pump subunit AcrA (membrane-fusion protein)
MKYLALFLVLLVVLGGGGYLIRSRMKSAETAAVNVQTTDPVARRTIEKIVSANGKVASNRDVDIKCQASGTIKNLPYTDVSREVKPGEILCQLDPIDMQRQLDTATAVVEADQSRITEAQLNRDIAKMALQTSRQRSEATLASVKAQAADAHAKAERTRQLYENKPTALASKEELDTAETAATQADSAVTNAQAAIAELDQQKLQIDTKELQIKQMQAALAQDQARLKTAQQNVEYCTVFAPLAVNPDDPPRWFISSLLTNIAPGYIVQSGTSGFSAGTTIMTLSDLSHVFVLASVDESDIGSVTDPVRGGTPQKVRVTADSFPGQVFEGHVVRVATKGVNTSNVVTFEVKIEITSDNRTLLRPEMTGTANIVCAARPDVLAIPAAAFSRASAGDSPAGENLVPTAGPRDPSVAPSGPSAAARGAATASATRRGGRGGRAPGSLALGAPQNGTVAILKDDGTTEIRPVVVGLMGTDPTDAMSGDFYEVISGLKEGENILLNKNGSDSKWKSNGANPRMMVRMGGGR